MAKSIDYDTTSYDPDVGQAAYDSRRLNFGRQLKWSPEVLFRFALIHGLFD